MKVTIKDKNLTETLSSVTKVVSGSQEVDGKVGITLICNDPYQAISYPSLPLDMTIEEDEK